MQVVSLEAAVAEPLAVVAQRPQERRHGYENRRSAQDRQLLLLLGPQQLRPPMRLVQLLLWFGRRVVVPVFGDVRISQVLQHNYATTTPPQCVWCSAWYGLDDP